MIAAMIAVATSSSASARADETAQCVASAERAQELSKAGKLLDAKAELTACGRAACPRIIQQDCAEAMTDLLRSLPSIIPAARDERGRDLVTVEVSLDGAPTLGTLDGRAIELDPGVHVVRFEAPGLVPVDERIVVRRGEVNRVVSVTLKPPADAPQRSTTARVVGASLGGVGIATAAVALVVGLTASSDATDLRERCAPRCAAADVDAIDARYTTATILGIAGGALFAAGLTVILVDVFGAKSAAAKTDTRAPSGALLPSNGRATLFRF